MCERVWRAWRNPLSESLYHTHFDPRSERVFFIPTLVKRLVASMFCVWFLLYHSNALLLQCVLGISTYLFCDDWALLQTERNSLSGIPLAVVTESETSCCICMDEIPVSHAARRLPCGHLFHSACLQKWIAQHRECPLCRRCTTIDSPHSFPGQTSSRDSSFPENFSEGPETSSSTPSPVPTTVVARRMERVPNIFRQQVVDAMRHRHHRPHPSLSETTVAPTPSPLSVPHRTASRLRNAPLHALSRRPDPHFSLSVDGAASVYHPTSGLSVAADHREDREWPTGWQGETEGVAGREPVSLASLLPAGLRRNYGFPVDSSDVAGISFRLEVGMEDSGSSTSSRTSSESSLREGSGSAPSGTLEPSSPEPQHQNSRDRDNDGVHSEGEPRRGAKHGMRATNLPRKPLSLGASGGEDPEEMPLPTRKSKKKKEVKKLPKETEKNTVEAVEGTTLEDVSLLQSSSPSSLIPSSIAIDDFNAENNEVRGQSTKSQRKRPRSDPSSTPKSTPSSKEKDNEGLQGRRRRRR